MLSVAETGASTGRTAIHRDPWSWSVALAAVLVCLPFMHYVGFLGDEGVLLRGAQRMLAGDLLYKDVFAILPPAPFLITVLWFDLVGDSWVAARLLGMLVIAGIAVTTYRVCRPLAPAPWVSALVVCLWLVWSQGLWSGLNHHWLTTLFTIGAVGCVLAALRQSDAPLRAATLAGVLVGSAGMTTPARGALLLLGVALISATSGLPRRALICFSAGVATVPFALGAWLAYQGTLQAAFDDIILFNLHHYSTTQSVVFGAGASAQSQPLVIAIPLAFALAALGTVLARGRTLRDPTFRALLIVAGVAVVSAYPRPDVVHLGFIFPGVLPLLVWTLTSLAKRLKRWIVVSIGIVALSYGALSVIALTKNAAAVGRIDRIATAQGDVGFGAFAGNDMAKLIPAIDATPPSAAFFFYPYDPLLSYLTRRRHVGIIDVMTPGYTTDAQYQKACETMLRDAEWVVFDRDWASPELLKRIFPALEDAAPESKLSFERVLADAYEPTLELEHFTLLRRRSDLAANEASKCKVQAD